GLHRALEPLAAVGEIDPDPSGPEPARHRNQPALGLRAERYAVDIAAPRFPERQALRLAGQQGPVHPEAEPHTGVLLATQFGHQAVVPATTADPGLRTKSIVDELEGGLGVVVQPAHQAGVLGELHTEVDQVLL